MLDVLSARRTESLRYAFGEEVKDKLTNRLTVSPSGGNRSADHYGAFGQSRGPRRRSLFDAGVVVTRKLERIADHSTNIAEDVLSLVKGVDVRHHAEVNVTVFQASSALDNESHVTVAILQPSVGSSETEG